MREERVSRLVTAGISALLWISVGSPPIHAEQAPNRFSGAFAQPNCGISSSDNTLNPRETTSSAWSCTPPYDTPVYTRPTDDSVVFGSLLEAAGYSGAATSAWVGIGAGNLCGQSDDKQLVLTQNEYPNFSILHGPTPHLKSEIIGGTGNLTADSSTSHPWRAVAVGSLDGGRQDHIVAVRKVTSWLVPDLVVARISCSCTPLDQISGNCEKPRIVTSTAIGNPSDSDWLGVAVGDFIGSGKKQIALLKRDRSQLFLVELNQNLLRVIHIEDLDRTSPTSRWMALAAGDIDGDGRDELIVARQVSDGQSPTVLTFKWDAADSAFNVFASSTVGNDGNSNWSAVAAGDFNADGRQAIVLARNQHANFVLLDLPPGPAQLRTLSTAELDSASGQDWAGLAATDWLGGDLGANELIAVRTVHYPYRTNLFVYGNPFHRVSRDSGLAGTKALYVQRLVDANLNFVTPAVEQLKQWITGTHTNTFNWSLGIPGDYRNLVNFLHATKDWGVDGKQLRVWVTVVQPSLVDPEIAPGEGCSQPEATPEWTSWDARDFFKNDLGEIPPDGKIQPDKIIAACRNILAWASVIGRLAKDFPHLVALGIDDFCMGIYLYGKCQDLNQDLLAEIQARMRSQAPWLNFVPTVYYGLQTAQYPDLALTFDSMLFYFRNQKYGQGPCSASICPLVYGKPPGNWGCLDGSCADSTIQNAVGEIAEMERILPKGRKMLGGVYFSGHARLGEPSARYDYDLTRLVLNLPSMAGALAYTLSSVVPPANVTCTEYNFLESKYCALQKAYGTKPQFVSHSELTPNGPLAEGRPSAYFVAAGRTSHVIYRGSDNHLYELRWATGPITQRDLIPNGPLAQSDPTAYFLATDGTQHVIYRGQDGHVHELWWTGSGPVGQGDLTPHGPSAEGNASAYFVATDGTQHVIYRSANGHLHELWWAGASPVGQGDLTPHGPLAASDPSAYYIDADETQHVIYRSADGHLHELWWMGPNPVGQGDITPHGSVAAGDPSAYFAAADGTQNVIYRSGDGHVHELWWTGPGPVGHGDLTPAGALAAGNPVAYFVPANGRHHVIYRSVDAHLHELSWTVGIVTHNDLTELAGAPPAFADPGVFVAPDGTHRVIYRGGDGRLHEVRWSDWPGTQ
jgi:hypothetical protein